MMTTTTATTTPAFPLVEGEGWTDKGQRALLWLLTHGEYASWRLDDDTVEAAYHGAGVAATARGVDAWMADQLAAVQASLRSTVARRQLARAERDARLQALFDAAGQGQAAAAPVDVQTGSQGPATGSQGGGGSKVPRVPKPSGPTPPAAVMAPPVPPVPAFVPVPALATLDAADLF